MEIERNFSQDEQDMLKDNGYKIYHTYFCDESGMNLSEAKGWGLVGGRSQGSTGCQTELLGSDFC